MPARVQIDRQKAIALIGENGFILIFIVWVIFLSIATDTFLKAANIFTVLRQSAIVSIVAIGEMLVMPLEAWMFRWGRCWAFRGSWRSA